MWSQANEIQSSCEIRRDSTDKKFKKKKIIIIIIIENEYMSYYETRFNTVYNSQQGQIIEAHL